MLQIILVDVFFIRQERNDPPQPWLKALIDAGVQSGRGFSGTLFADIQNSKGINEYLLKFRKDASTKESTLEAVLPTLTILHRIRILF